MRRISVGLVIRVDADIAKNYERLRAYLEAQLKEMREKDEMA